MKPLIRTVVLFSMVMNLLWLFPALYSLQVFDRVLSSRSIETLLVLLGGVLVVLMMIGLLDFVRSRLLGVMGAYINDSMAPEIARVSLAIGARRQGGPVGEGLRDLGRIRAFFSSQGLIAIADAPWALIYIAVIAAANIWLGALAAASAVLMLLLAFANDRLTKNGIGQLQREAGGVQSFLDRALGNAEVAQAMGMSNALVSRWNQMSVRASETQDPLAQRSVAMGSATKIARQLTQILMISLGAYLVLKGQATPGVMIASSILLGRALLPIEQLVGSWKIVAEGRQAWKQLTPLMEEARQRPAQMSLPEPKGELVATGVIFRPPKSERALLSGISLKLEPGESMAIIGPSGAGKSTLVRVLIGLWAPSQGQVRLDGVDLSSWTREQIGPYIGYMPQDVELFAGTVADNIGRMGTPEPEHIISAAKLAGVHEMILGLPDGYDTVVSPQAALLSPGQRQRIALARALYGNPRLVVLDEPNANLDGAGEAALVETIRQLRGRATVIVVTHRQSLTRDVQKMLVVEGGRQLQFGRTEEVMAAMRAAAPSADGQVVSMARPAAQAAGAGGREPAPRNDSSGPAQSGAPAA